MGKLNWNIISNVFVVFACAVTLLAMSPIAYQRLLNPKRTVPMEYKVGQKASVPGVELGAPTLVLAVSPRCGVCARDAEDGVYERLGAASSKLHTLVVSTGAEETEVRQFLSLYHFASNARVEMPKPFPFSGTPYIILIDHAGAIFGAWRGGVSGTPNLESDVIAQIKRMEGAQMPRSN